MFPHYHTLSELITLTTENNREQFLRLYEDIALNPDLSLAVGSSHNHQAWSHGYLDHIKEVCNIGLTLFSSLNNLRTLPFTYSEMIEVLLLHDLEKPWKYGQGYEFFDKDERHAFRLSKVGEYAIHLTDEQLVAIRYCEGEGGHYSSHGRTMNELATLCHMADVASARIWFNEGKKGTW